jgi:hypothetical protein
VSATPDGLYVRKHDPFLTYPDVYQNPARAVGGLSRGWGIWPEACGARSGIPGVIATVLSRWR